jgi:hypothetical protein
VPGPAKQFLRIAEVTLAVHCDFPWHLQTLEPLYRHFSHAASTGNLPPDIDIRLVADAMPPMRHLKKIFDTRESWSLYSDAKTFWLSMAPPQRAKPFWIARFDRRVKRVTVYVEPALSRREKKKVELYNPICYPLDQLLLMYFLASRRGLLAHAAGMVRKGQAMIFPGHSGAGKSTFALLLAEAKAGKLLSDERMVVRELDGSLQAFGTPWAGTEDIASNGCAPLAGIFFLKHGERNHLRELTAESALECLLPILSIPWYDPEVMSRIIAFAKHLLAKVPAYEMSFKPDRSAIDFFLKFQKTIS